MAAFIVFTRIRTHNPDELKLYSAQVPGVEAGAIQQFASMEAARAWYHSAPYQDASRHRFIGGDYSAVIVEGLAPS